MTQEEVMKMENSELICNFLIKRDNTTSCKRALNCNPLSEDLQRLFDLERNDYDMLLKEIYRRMNHGRK